MWKKSKRMRATVFGGALSVAVAALAFYAVTTFTGEGSTTLGKEGSATVLAANVSLTKVLLVPGQQLKETELCAEPNHSCSPIEVRLHNTTSKPVTIKAGSITFTDSKEPACKPEWFALDSSNGEWGEALTGKKPHVSAGNERTIEPGAELDVSASVTHLAVTFLEVEAVDQTACSEGVVTAHVAFH